MRYFGKDGCQCRPICQDAHGKDKARLLARSVAFGRVPRRAVMWLGLGVMAITLGLGVWCFTTPAINGPGIAHDLPAAIMIHR